jgi:hypothetical protein
MSTLLYLGAALWVAIALALGWTARRCGRPDWTWVLAIAFWPVVLPAIIAWVLLCELVAAIYLGSRWLLDRLGR